MARTAAARTALVEIGAHTLGHVTHRDYAVEVRQGQVRRSIGTVHGAIGTTGSASWYGVPVGADAGTLRYRTRREAIDALYRREDFRAARAEQDAARRAALAA